MVKHGYKQTEIGEIPEDWGVEKIGAFDPFVTSGSRGWAQYYSQYGSPFVRITNMVRGSVRLDLSDLRYVDLPTLSAEGKRTALQNDDILVSITADIGICSLVNSELQAPAYINQHIALVRFNSKKIAPRFVAYYLNSRQVQKLFVRSSDQGAKTGMNLDTVRSIEFAVPQYDEQKAIADALSDTDELIASLEKLIEKKRDIKTATMQQLLTGKKRLPGFVGDWTELQFAEFTTMRSGAGFPLGLQGDVSSKTPFFKVSDFNHSENATFMRRSNNYLSEERVSQYGYKPIPENSIVIAKIGAAIFLERKRILDRKSLIDNNMMALIFEAFVANYRFLHQLLLTVKLSDLVSTTALPSLSASDIGALQISLPCLEEQAAIADVLVSMDEEIDFLGKRLTKAQAIKQGMMQELLTGRTRVV